MEKERVKKLLAGFTIAGLITGVNVAGATDKSDTGSSSCSGKKMEASKTGCSGKTGCGGEKKEGAKTGCGGGTGCSGEMKKDSVKTSCSGDKKEDVKTSCSGEKKEDTKTSCSG